MNDIQNIITQLEDQKNAIEHAITALRTVGGTTGSGEGAIRKVGRPRGRVGKRRGMSPEGKLRQAEAMRQYWAAKRAGKTTGAKKTAAKKVGLTEAGRKKLSENMKRRWAAKKAAATKAKGRAA